MKTYDEILKEIESDPADNDGCENCKGNCKECSIYNQALAEARYNW